MNFTRPKASQPVIDPADSTPSDRRAVDPIQAGPIPEPGLDRDEYVPTQDKPSLGRKVLDRSRYLLSLYGGLVGAFLVFYALADYTAYTVAEQRPGQLIISNTMTQLWTACFRMAFILAASLGLLRLFWPELFRFFRPGTDGPDMMTTIKYELTSFQRLCVFLLAFFGLCFLFIQLLSVNLPQTVSVGR
ncbi:hypothetical protein GCM10028819_32040 [Spirosoma humi]